MMPRIAQIDSSCPRLLSKYPYSNKIVLGSLVLKVVNDAKKDKRVVQGLQRCSQFLETNPGDSLVCLVDPEHDATTQMFLLLITAFCNENCIPLIKVAGLERIRGKSHSHRRSTVASPGDFACVLIKMPKATTMSADEAKLITLLRVAAESDDGFVPQAELPD